MLDGLEHRPVGDSLAVRKAPAFGDGSSTCDVVQKLVDESRLADACRPQDREELARPVAERLLEGIVEPTPFTLAPENGRDEPTRVAALRVHESNEPQGGSRRMRERLDDDGVAHDPARQLVDEDRSRLALPRR